MAINIFICHIFIFYKFTTNMEQTIYIILHIYILHIYMCVPNVANSHIYIL